MKSKAAYTTKWLNRNKHLWFEVKDDNGINIIIIKKVDAPTIVRERVLEINAKRCNFTSSFIREHKGEPIETIMYFGRPLLTFNKARQEGITVFAYAVNYIKEHKKGLQSKRA